MFLVVLLCSVVTVVDVWDVVIFVLSVVHVVGGVLLWVIYVSHHVYVVLYAFRDLCKEWGDFNFYIFSQNCQFTGGWSCWNILMCF